MEGNVTATLLPDVDIKQGIETSFSDTLDKLCVYYMALGVDANEFWNGDYTLLKYYVERHRIAVEQKNEELWLQGVYFYEALSVALAQCFSKHSQAKYAEKPHRITPLSEEEQAIENQKMVDTFRENLMALGRRFEAKEKQPQGGDKQIGGNDTNL